MNIKSRIERLEKVKTEAVSAETQICSHPAASLSYSANYMPESGSYKPEFQYTEGFHCYNCCFQDYIFTRYGLDACETEFLYVLKDTLPGYRLRTDLIALLCELGIIAFVKFPATDEQKRNCLLPPLINARKSQDRIAALSQYDNIELTEAIKAENERLNRGCDSLVGKIENELKKQGKNTTLAELEKEWEKEWEKWANSKTFFRRFA